MKKLSRDEQHQNFKLQAEETIKAREEVKKKSRAMYRSLFMNMQNSFSLSKIVLDSEGKPVDYEYVEVNDAFEKVVGKKREEVVGKRATEVFPNLSSSPSKWIERCGKVALTGVPETVYEMYSPVMGKWVDVSIYSPEPGYFSSIFTDITEQKNYTEAMKEAKEAAEVASRTKSSFLAYMSHEIRTPLNGIMGFIDLTLLTDLTEDQKDNLNTIKDSANSLLNIINDILDFSKLKFSVKDTGIGIAEKDLSKLFKDFSQLDSSITREYGGTGLGLIICKRLVEMMGGTIWVESKKNQGSNFSFTVVLSN